MSKPEPTARPATLPAWMILVTILLTGGTIMMLEVVGTRVIGPYFGVGIYVWSALITVTLLALAGGYALGGVWADRRPRPGVMYAIIVAAGAAVLLVPLLRTPVLTLTAGLGVRGGALAGSALLFGPPLVLLGMVTPFATKLYTLQFERLGARVGALYAVSTLGSFAGTLLMGFYLIPSLPLSMILNMLGVLLLLLSAASLVLRRPGRWPALVVLVAAAAALTAWWPASSDGTHASKRVRLVHKTTSFYGEIKVVDVGHRRLLLVDGVTQSGTDVEDPHVVPPYVLDMDALGRWAAPEARSVLMVGLGGGNLLPFLLDRGLDVDVVEIDRKISVVAQRYFGVDPARIHLVLDDGRHYLRACNRRYDLILLNTFSGESFPSHMLTREFFLEVRERLNPGGVMLVNFVGYVQGPHRQAAASVAATLRSATDWCRTYFREPPHQFSNILYLAGAGEPPAPPASGPAANTVKTEVTIAGWEQAPVCTDDYCPVEFLNRDVYLRWRRLVMESLGPDILLN